MNRKVIDGAIFPSGKGTNGERTWKFSGETEDYRDVMLDITQLIKQSGMIVDERGRQFTIILEEK